MTWLHRLVTIALVITASTTTAGVVGPGGASAATCPPVPKADTSTASGWIGYLATHPDDYGLTVTNGDRVTLSHNADRRFPTASAAKLINLAAYARAVATGAVSPGQTVSVNEWERWYLPIDGNAHVEALQYLKLPPLAGVPGSVRRASLRVTLGQLADVMIRFSDSAAADTLRRVLGDTRLSAVMNRYGMPGPPPLFAGLYLSLVDPRLNTQARAQSAGQRFYNDPTYRAASFTAAGTQPFRPTAAQVDATYSQTARALNRLMGSLATGSFGPGSQQARAVLEQNGSTYSGATIGFKGGSLGTTTNSVLAENFELRSPSGSVSTATLVVHRLSASDFTASNYAQQTLLLHATNDPTAVRALQCVINAKGRQH